MIKYIYVIILLSILVSCTSSSSSSSPDNRLKVDGYSYEVLKKGSGRSVKAGDIVFFDIDIMSPTDSILKSKHSYRKQPQLEIPEKDEKVNKNPLLSALTMAHDGDSLVVYIPRDSMKRVPPAMKKMEYVKYVMAIKKVVNGKVYQEEQNAKMEKMKVRESEVAALVKKTISNYKSNKSKFIKLNSGLEYIIHEEGVGGVPAIGKMVEVNYYGVLLSTGKMFDNSFKRGKSFSFPLGQGRVIKGWDEGIAKLKKGTKATLIIPAELGYGKAGSPPNIPEDATLAFYVEVI